MKICFLTPTNPSDNRSWSGIYARMYEQLSLFSEVDWIGEIAFSVYDKFLLRFHYLVYRNLYGKYENYNIFRTKIIEKNIYKKLQHHSYHIFFAPASSQFVALSKLDKPIIYLSDATFELMINYYQEFSAIHPIFQHQGNTIEKLAIHKASHLIYASNWAANSAVQQYGANADKISILGFGANLLYEPENIFDHIHNKNFEVCNLLFVGVDWKRKGGVVAYECLLRLKELGIKTTLTIVGCNPTIKNIDNDVLIIPFINKKNREEFLQLDSLFRKAHFLILPTRADCYGVVFSEASAYGVPSLATDTGGVSAAITQNENGYLFPLTATGSDYANKVYELFTDEAAYRTLCRKSRNLYETKLSWKNWGIQMKSIIDKIMVSNGV